MKSKTLLFGVALATSVSLNAQFSSGVVSLGSTGMTLKVDTTPTLVKYTLTGASNSYLGIGLGADGMAEGADGFIYNNSTSRDYTFGGIGVPPTADTTQDWTVVSDNVVGTTRTIVAQRSLAGGAGDTAIPNAAGAISIFFARGGSLTIAQHSGTNRGYTTLNMSPSLAVNDVQYSKPFMIYPNPVKDELNFKNAENISTINILDLNGKVISSTKAIQEKMNVSKIQPGIYFIEITDKSGNVSYQKMIKD